MDDPVDHPSHYTDHASGVECIQVTEHMNFCRGNAVKYIWRAGAKGDEVEDLRKAVWYLNREISRISERRRKVRAAATVQYMRLTPDGKAVIENEGNDVRTFD